MKSLNQIRDTFIKYFKQQGHNEVPSSSLVPHNDPTLMFTNSGMVQFKNVFTGLEKKDFNRAVTAQKCVRAGGKHNDLENVGYTSRHHTFFEMLGNFSFGDYFKELAIELAWNLVTKDFGLSKDRLLVTVYADDDDAYKLWKKIAGLPENRIIKVSTSDNFWSMGDTGPCGPCSEIFYDHGEKFTGSLPGSKNGDEGERFVEIWNLVFMQFEQISDTERINLPKPSVDTGMGLERIGAVLSGTHDNYETDVFKRIMSAISEMSKTSLSKKNVSHRVIADHLRAICFLISDGVLPANDGRGYVLRRILRRALRHTHLLNPNETYLYRLVDVTVGEMKTAYPDLVRAESLIRESIRTEEIKFKDMLSRGLKVIDSELASLGSKNKINPEIVFKLYDTYGFPVDLISDILKNKGKSFDLPEFNKLLDLQREKSRLSWVGSGEQKTDKLWFQIRDKHGPTEFLGYDLFETEAKVVELIRDGKVLTALSTGDEGYVLSNQTPFYAESGGQVGDTGKILKGSEFLFEVRDTKKEAGDLHAHYGKVLRGSLGNNDIIKMQVNEKRRLNTRANHSATHLLHESLRRVLGSEVTQRGSYVSHDRLRFDFNYPKQMTADEILKVEKMVNDVVRKKSNVETAFMSVENAKNTGALALFGENYGEEVRVLSIGIDSNSKNFSMELCGGTHVKNTSEIGRFAIVGEKSIGSGVRRIEAMRGDFLGTYETNQEAELNQEKNKILKSTNVLKKNLLNLGISPISGDESDKAYIQVLTKQLDEARRNKLLKNVKIDRKNIEIINDINFLAQRIDNADFKDLRKFVDGAKKELKRAVIVCAGVAKNRVAITVGVTDDLNKFYNSVDLVKIGAEKLGGQGGGGRPDFAQAGGPLVNEVEAAITAIRLKIGK